MGPQHDNVPPENIVWGDVTQPVAEPEFAQQDEDLFLEVLGQENEIPNPPEADGDGTNNGGYHQNGYDEEPEVGGEAVPNQDPEMELPNTSKHQGTEVSFPLNNQGHLSPETPNHSMTFRANQKSQDNQPSNESQESEIDNLDANPNPGPSGMEASNNSESQERPKRKRRWSFR